MRSRVYRVLGYPQRNMQGNTGPIFLRVQYTAISTKMRKRMIGFRGSDTFLGHPIDWLNIKKNI
jgi:hypothetical protein